MGEFEGVQRQRNEFQNLSMPETIIDEGFRATLEYFEKLIPKENIAKHVHAMRNSAQTEEMSREAEVNALAGYFMEPIWAEAKKWIAAHPHDLMELTGGSFENTGVVSDEEIRSTFERDLDDGISLLYERSLDTIGFQALLFGVTQEERVDEYYATATPSSSMPYDIAAFGRYNALLLSPFYQSITADTGIPDIHITGGFQTAGRITWGTLRALPELFKATYGRQPDTVELEKLVASGKEFVLNLAKTEFGILAHIESEIGEKVNLRSGKVRVEGIELLHNLYLREENGKFKIEIEKEALKRIANRVLEMFRSMEFPKGRAVRTGCPAIVARGEEGQSIAVELYDWFADLAKKFYFPKATQS